MFHSPVPSSPISVMISPVSGSAIANEAYSLICSVTEEITGLTGSPSVQWIGPDDNTVVPTTGSMSNQTSSSVTLTFQPLTTSSGGLYTCLATLPSPAVTGDITVSISQPVIVESMLLNVVSHTSIMTLYNSLQFPVPVWSLQQMAVGLLVHVTSSRAI